MQVIYIKHSGFLVEDDNASYLFDYYDGEIPVINEQKPMYCFASHSHYDHFSPKIFTETSCHPNVHYILSNDIEREKVPDQCISRTVFLGKDERMHFPDSNVRIVTLKSTDQGVAFIVSSDGKLIYHAGDLHDWIWEEEGDAYNKQMEEAYLKEMNKIAGFHFKAAFLPLDPRQSKESIPKGIRLFLQYASTDYLFPMHMWEEYHIAEEFMNTPDGKKCPEFMKISRQNQKFIIG